MKRIIYLIITLITIVSCKQQSKDYVTISGKIINKNSDSLTFGDSKRVLKKIYVAEDGTFSDTLRVTEQNCIFFDGKEMGHLYLKNGYDIYIYIDAKQFDETIIYKGIGADGNNYLAQKNLYYEKAYADQSIWSLKEDAFNTKVNEITLGMSELISNTKNLDDTFIEAENKDIIDNNKNVFRRYKSMREEKDYFSKYLDKGKASPKFVNYVNYDGGTTSLDDLKGKYVYIDLWATWCAPCIKEIPFLKEIEKQYHGKNIVFVSISTDKEKDFDKWKKMVKEKELKGVQLFAANKTFTETYKVQGIPRFILIDPNGNIIDANSPRPSQPELSQLLDSLDL